MKELDFYGFPKSSKAEWFDKVTRDLKGKDFQETLVSELWDNIKIDPMYFPAEVISSQMSFHPKSEIPGMAPHLWNNLVAVEIANEKQANTEILKVLNSGADGIVLQITGQPDLSKVLADVMTEYIQLYFMPLGEPAELQMSLEQYVSTQPNLNTKLHGGILWSPSSSLIKGGGENLNFSFASELMTFYDGFQNFRPLSIDFSHYAESGANGLQELAFGLAEVIEIVDGLREYSPEQVFQNLSFTISVGSDYFAEIAKLKAARNLISSLADLYDFTLKAEEINFLSATNSFTKSFLDPDSNLIRQTFEAMSAILGGANSIWVKPMARDEADSKNKRIARNVSILLKDESHLDKVMDPAAGAYFLDQIQAEIELNIKRDLEEIEAKGGWYVKYKAGEIQNEVRKERGKIQQSVLNLNSVKVGANKYQKSNSENSPNSFQLIEERPLQLKATRATYLVEKSKFLK